MSARQFEAAGFGAIATTSGGLAWALGFPDGERAPWQEVVAATARIVRAVRVPVTADIEAGYGDTPDRVGTRVAEILQAGVFGFNIEDGTPSPDRPVRAIEDASARIRVARAAANAAGVPAVINARVDLYLKNIGDPESRLAETVWRSKAYLAAGADCIYPFGLADVGTIARLTQALDGAPVNIVARPDTSLPQLERIGIARVSIASGAALTVMSLIKQIGGRAVRQPSLRRAEAFDQPRRSTKAV